MSNKFFEAAKTDNLPLAKQIFALNIDINEPNDLGETPLIVSVKHRSHNVMNFLLESSAKNYLKDHQSRTALHWAVDKKDLESICALLNYHAPIEVVDKDGNTPIKLAELSGVKALEDVFQEFEITNYHADRLALRRDIESLVDDHDIVTEVSHGFRELMSKIQDEKLKERLLELSQELYQPEELIAFSQNPLGRLAAEAKLNKDKKKEKDRDKRNSLRDRLTRISKGFSKIDSVSMEGYLNCELSADSVIFKRLNKLIKIIEEVHAEFQPILSNVQQLTELFSTLTKFYRSYIDEICRFRGDMRQDLFMGQIRMRGFLGSRYLRYGSALRFKEFFEKIAITATESSDNKVSAVPIRDTKSGLHQVIHLLHTFYKIKPSAPAKENMVDTLNKIISGKGSAPTELIFLEKGSELLPVLASKAVYGENLLDLLIEHPDYISLIETFNYSNLFMSSILTKFDDAKLDNFIAILEKNAQSKVVSIIIVGIDNDLAFNDIILTYPENTRLAGKHFVKMKSAFLLMPQMNQSIDPQFAQLFLKHIPEFVIIKLLKTLLLREKETDELKATFAARMSSENSLRKNRVDLLNQQFQEIKLPLKLKPGTIDELYHTIHSFQAILRKKPQITHHELLEEFSPILAAYHKHIRENRNTNNDDPKWPRIVNDQVYLYSAPDLEDILTQPFDLTSYKATDADQDILETETLSQASENFINRLDYQKLGSAHLEGELIEKVVTDFSFLKTLIIRNSRSLSDHRLETIAQNFKSLESITLINCSAVKGNGLSAMLCYRKDIKIMIDQMPQLSVTCLLDLLQHHSDVTIRLDGKLYILQQNAAVLLKAAMLKEEYYTLVTALLIRGVHLNAEHTFSPLHVATQAGLNEVIEEFIRYGAVLNSTDHENKTALDIASEQYNKEKDVFKKSKRQQIVVTLFMAGAFHCKNPAFILTIVLRSLTADKFASSSSLLEKLFNFAHCHNQLNAELVTKLVASGLKTLDLSVPRHMNLGQHHVSLEVIKALKYRLATLEHLNITGCSGLSVDILKEMATWKLKSLTMSFDQAAQCKLISMDTLNEAGNLKLADQLLNCKFISDTEFRTATNTEIRISHLNLSGKRQELQGKAGDKVISEIHALLIRSQYLTELELANCGITAERLKPIINGLAYNKSVKVLLLSRNPLKEEGVRYLFETMLHNSPQALKNLTELSLDSVSASSDSGALIGELIEKHEALEVLSLHDNQLGDAGVLAIANSIQERLKAQKTGGKELKLKQLHLNQVEMGDSGARALSRALLFHRGLNYLDVGFNSAIHNEGLLAFIELLELSTSIQIFKGDGLAPHADAMLKTRYEFLTQNRKHGVQLARLDKLAKSNQIQWQRHLPEIFTKTEEDEAYQRQVASMSHRIQEQENEIARLKKLLGLPEISKSSVQVTESASSSPIVAKTPRPVIGRTRTNSPGPTNTTSTVLFDAATSIKTAIKSELQKLMDLGYKFDYSQHKDQFHVKVISENVDNKQLSNLWQFIVKSIENYDGSNKVETENGLLLKGLSSEQIKKLDNLLNEMEMKISANALQL